MSTECPNCGESLSGEPVLDLSGESQNGHPPHLVMRDGEISIEVGADCPSCDWEKYASFKPDDVFDKPPLR